MKFKRSAYLYIILFIFNLTSCSLIIGTVNAIRNDECFKENREKRLGKYFDLKKCQLVFDFCPETMTRFTVNASRKDTVANKWIQLYSYEKQLESGSQQKVFDIPKPDYNLIQNEIIGIEIYTTERSSAVYYIEIKPSDWLTKKKLWAKQERS